MSTDSSKTGRILSDEIKVGQRPKPLSTVAEQTSSAAGVVVGDLDEDASEHSVRVFREPKSKNGETQKPVSK